MKTKLFAQLFLAIVFCMPSLAVAQDDGSGLDSEVMIQKVIEAGKTGNQVQSHLDYLTNRIGPRLTGSEGMMAACQWASDEFTEMGLESRLEKWGEFPVGFERGPSSGMMISPKKMKLDFGTNAWTAGTKGRESGRVVVGPKSIEQLEEIRDSIKGAYVMVDRMPRRRRARRRGRAPATEQSKSAEQGKSAEKAPDAEKADEKKVETPQPTREQLQAIRDAIMECGPAGIIRSTSNDLILTGGNYRQSMDKLPTTPEITLKKDQWEEIKELVNKGEDVQLSFDIRNHFREGPISLHNVIADIRGTEWPDQYVIVGGHIDSWDGATGATDNGAGCATTIEAARILMAAGVKPKRTIRFMLWSGEEQGLLGSRAFVEQNREDVSKNVSAVFVHDGGTNYVAGIRCTEAMKADFETIFEPVMDLDERTPFEIDVIEKMLPRGGSDHTPFIRAGVPGFFWMQRGRARYRTTHHTQYDTYETVVPEYQEHSSIVIAVGALGTANLDHLLPRDGIQNN